MRTLLITISLLFLAGCVPTITRQQLEGLKQQTGGGHESMGMWAEATSLWYTGTSGDYDYYQLDRPTGSVTYSHDEYRVLTQDKGDEFPRTSDRSRWRRIGSPGAYIDGQPDGVLVPHITEPTIKIVPSTKPYDSNDLHL
jgi:hypothetical protein